jgi:hypothetical protein
MIDAVCLSRGYSMTTIVELTPEELAELQQFTQRDDPAHAATAAIREYIRYAKRLRLIELSDQIEMEENWRELEQQELDEQQSN